MCRWLWFRPFAALWVEAEEGVGEPGPHRGGGCLLCLVQLCEERVGEGERADVGVVGASSASPPTPTARGRHQQPATS